MLGAAVTDPVCWNCGKHGCCVSTYNQPKNQAKIDKNRKEWSEKKKQERDKH